MSKKDVIVQPNKMMRWELDKHPKGRDWNQVERNYAIAALVKHNGVTEKAYNTLKKWHTEDIEESGESDIYLPPTKAVAKKSLAAIKRHNHEAIMEQIVSDEMIWDMKELAEEAKSETVRADLMKYFVNRVHGMPTQKTENINVNATFDDIKKAREKDEQEYGKWYEGESPE